MIEYPDPDKFTEDDAPFMLEEPTREGYVFQGWSLIGERKMRPVLDYVVDTSVEGDIVLEAVWDPHLRAVPPVLPAEVVGDDLRAVVLAVRGLWIHSVVDKRGEDSPRNCGLVPAFRIVSIQ